MTKVIEKAAWILVRNGMILSTLSKGKDTFYIPGGKVEVGESHREALIREVREELSVELDQNSLRRIGVFEAQAHGHSDDIVVRMTCFTGAYSGELAAASEIERVVWLSHSDKERSSQVDQAIFDHLFGLGLLK